MRTIVLGVAVMFCLPGASFAQEIEQLPPPQQVIPPQFLLQTEPYVSPWVPPPLDSRAGWIYFAPNALGQMRYRIVQSPVQSYYLYNGRPYYGLQARQPYLLPTGTDRAVLTPQP